MNEIIFLILSEDFAHDVIPKVSEALQLKFILIWFEDDNMSRSSSPSCDKVLGRFDNLDALCGRIEHGMMNIDSRSSDRFTFDELRQRGTRDLSSQSPDFLW